MVPAVTLSLFLAGGSRFSGSGLWAPLGLEPSLILGTVPLAQWLGHSCVRCLGSAGHSSLCCSVLLSQSSFLSSVPAAYEPPGRKIGVHGRVVQDRNLYAAPGGSRKKLVASMREMRYLRLGFFHVLTFRPRNSPGLQAYSTPAYLGWYIRAAATSSRSVAHYAIGGVWSCAPPLRPRGRPGVFHRRAAPPHRPSPGHPLLSLLLLLSFLHRSYPRRVSTAGLGSSRLSLRPRLLGLRFLGEYVYQGCPADAGRRLTAWSRRPSTSCSLSWRRLALPPATSTARVVRQFYRLTHLCDIFGRWKQAHTKRARARIRKASLARPQAR